LLGKKTVVVDWSYKRTSPKSWLQGGKKSHSKKREITRNLWIRCTPVTFSRGSCGRAYLHEKAKGSWSRQRLRGWQTFFFNSFFGKITGFLFSLGYLARALFGNNLRLYNNIGQHPNTQASVEIYRGGMQRVMDCIDLGPLTDVLVQWTFGRLDDEPNELHRIFRLIPLTTLWLPCDGCKSDKTFSLEKEGKQ